MHRSANTRYKCRLQEPRGKDILLVWISSAHIETNPTGIPRIVNGPGDMGL